MAISWGSWRYSGGNGMRVGVGATVATNVTQATITFRVYTENQHSYSDDQTLSYSGSAGSGSTAFSNNQGGGAVLRATRTWTHTYNANGDSPGTQSFTATLSGAYNGVTPSVSVSVPVPARPVSPPAAPSGVAATRNNDNSHTITWSNNPTGNAPYEFVEIRRWNNVTNNWVQIAVLTHPATSYTWTNAGADARYRYAVRATNAAGKSSFAYSNFLSNTPAAPTNAVATPSVGGNVLTWENRARWSEGVRIERREDSGAWTLAATLGPTATTWTHSSPNPAYVHTYRVAATVTGPTLTSTWAVSNEVELASPPNAPTNLEPSSAFDASEDRDLTWTHNPTDGSPQQAFQVRHRPAGGAWVEVAQVASGVSSWTLPAGTYANGQTVEWEVATWGVHPDSSPYSATAAMMASARPTVTINDPDGTTWTTSALTVTWGYLQADGSPQSSWEVRLEDADGVVLETRSGPGAATSAALTTVLADATTYTVYARGRSAAGLWSPWDQVTFPVAYAKPPVPVIAAEWDVTTGATILTLTNPAETGAEVAAVANMVQRRIGYGGDWITIATDVPLNTTITDPIPHLSEINYYRAVAVSSLPSTQTSLVIESPALPFELEGMAFVNAGPGFATVAGMWEDARIDLKASLRKVALSVAGRTSPVGFDTEFFDRAWSVSGVLHSNESEPATFALPALLEAVQRSDGPQCYRDVLGNRWFGQMGSVDSSRFHSEGTVGFSFVEIDHTEGA